MLIKLLALGLSLMACLARAQSSVPEDLATAVRLDQSYNIRGLEPLTADQRKTIPILHVDVPLRHVELALSRHLDEKAKQEFVRVGPNGAFVRMFFRNPQNPLYVRLAKKYGANPVRYRGTRLQSHSTYLVWDEQSSARFYIKFEGGTTRQFTAKNAVAIDDYVEDTLGDDPHDTFVSVLPERFAATFKTLLGSYTYSVRDVEPTRKPHGENLELWPVHGFLGSPDLEDIARRNGETVEDWMVREYAPKLAKFIARANYEYGFYPEAHTQNLLFHIDRETGEIAGFAFRDLNDVAIDPLPRLAKGKHMPSGTLDGLISVSRLGKMHMGTGGDRKALYDAAWVNGGYIGGWNFGHITTNEETANKLFDSFFQAFVPEVERITGVKIDASKFPKHGYNYQGGFPGGTVFQDIYDQFLANATARWAAHALNYKQSVLAAIFEAHYNITYEVAILDAGFRLKYDTVWGRLRAQLSFDYDGRSVIAIDRSTGKPVAAAYNLQKSEKVKAQNAFRPPSSWTCQTLFSEF